MSTEDKKEIIREHAIEVIAKKGFQNTKIKDIAIESGIASGTIYNYFSSKDEVMNYIINTEFEKRIKVLKSDIENNKPFQEVINDILEYHINEIKENPSLVKLIMQEAFQMMGYTNQVIRDILNENNKLMIEIVVSAQQRGEISKNFDAEFIAASILYSFRSFAYAYVKNDNINFDLDKLKKQIKQFYVNGLI